MASEKHSYQTDAAQLKIDFGELNISPEEETAYKKAQEELNAYHLQRRELRLRLALPILQNFEAWLISEVSKVLPKSPIGKAIRYTLEHYDRLCRYVADGRYKIDTNMVENG